MQLSKEITAFYPDLIAAGSLAKALQAALKEQGSTLEVGELDTPFGFVVYARVQHLYRSSQVYIAAGKRLFSFDFWSRGVCLANGWTADLDQLAQALDKWLSDIATTGEMAAAFDFIRIKPEAAAFERGEEVEMRWQQYLEWIPEHEPRHTAFVQAAARCPQLRQLFPYMSLMRFCFSRCTGYPYSYDTPRVYPAGENEYEVRSFDEQLLGRGDAEAAVRLVVSALPPDCGPARPGTAEDLPSD